MANQINTKPTLEQILTRLDYLEIAIKNQVVSLEHSGYLVDNAGEDGNASVLWTHYYAAKAIRDEFAEIKQSLHEPFEASSHYADAFFRVFPEDYLDKPGARTKLCAFLNSMPSMADCADDFYVAFNLALDELHPVPLDSVASE